VTDDAPVFTARMAAVMRGVHLLVDDLPPIFRDDYALALSQVSAAEATALVDGFEPSVGAVFRTTAVVRARFTDERVQEAVARGTRQYVILGAGLDAFAWRRPDLAPQLHIFEVDHPGTQGYKRERLEAEGMAVPGNLHFVAVDFAALPDLAGELAKAGFRSDWPTIWSWLGVMVYLTHEQIRATLKTLAQLSAPGSALVADFLLDRSLMDDAAKMADDIGRPAAADEGGEPYVSTFDAGEVTTLMASGGWSECRTWLPFDFAPWFMDRTDHLGPSTYVGLLLCCLGQEP
jgi:methyltransferase (TIGR00027 family)